jgi:hypothetical protein
MAFAPNSLPPLKPIHGLDQKVLDFWNKISTAEIIESLKPGNPESLKAWPDGRILNGHHRLQILKDRGVRWSLSFIVVRSGRHVLGTGIP